MKAMRLWCVLTAFVSALGLPAELAAQTGASGIAGVVRDSSGAVIPGVTVEASSPALIEKVRSVGQRRRRASTGSSTCGRASTP